MEAEELDRMYEVFRDFHAFFAPVFGRRQWGEHSGYYLQSEERRDAENLAEMVPVSPGPCSAFSPRRPGTMLRLSPVCRSILVPGRRTPWRSGLRWQRFSQTGGQVRGGSPAILWGAGEGGKLPGGVSPSAALRTGPTRVGPRVRALMDKRLYLPEG
jgi:hypothetical protein